MTDTKELSLRLLGSSEVNGAITFNEDMYKLDAFASVKSRTDAVPGSPLDGDAYIVSAATGGWAAGSVDDIAVYYNSTWIFISPSSGIATFVQDELVTVRWSDENVQWEVIGGGMSINTQAGTYTAVASDAFKVIRMNSGSAQTLTIPQESSVDYPIGTVISIRMSGAGALTMTTTGLTLNGSFDAWSQHVEQAIRKVGSDEWDVVK